MPVCPTNLPTQARNKYERDLNDISLFFIMAFARQHLHFGRLKAASIPISKVNTEFKWGNFALIYTNQYVISIFLAYCALF